MSLKRNLNKFAHATARRLQSSGVTDSTEPEPTPTSDSILATGEQDYGLAYQISYKGGFNYEDLRDADYGSIP